MKWKTREDLRQRRHLRLRKKVRGTAIRPRMAVYRSNKHLYVQFIDDASSATLASASTMAADLRTGGSLDTEKAQVLGRKAAEAARVAGIEHVVMDRGGFKYSGRIKAFADAAREAGLKF